MRTLSLNTKLVAGCMLMLAFALVLSTSLIFMFSSYYVRAERDVMLLTVFKRVLVAASELAKERGPIHTLLSEDPDMDREASELLMRYRATSDDAIDTVLRPVAGGLNLAQDPELVAGVDRVRRALAEGRQAADVLAAMPKSQRSADKMLQATRDMFLAVDLIRPITVATVAKIAAEDPALAGPALVAEMLGEMRDYSARLVDELVPFVTARTLLPDSFMLDRARLRERVLEIWQLANRQGGLYADDARLETLRVQINARFFAQGLQTVDRVASTGRFTGDFGITTKELTERYIPTLEPIKQLGEGFLNAALDRLDMERQQALIWLVVVSIVAIVIVAATLALIVIGRYFVLRPLMIASDSVVALSAGEAHGEVKCPTNSREMLRLFDALEGLRIILSERQQHTERLKILSETDGLTGLINRRMLDRVGQGNPEFDGLLRDVSVIMMDLDRFKGINDTYGHLAGDLVLKHAATIVRRVCRKNDLAARYGGEEIAIVIFEQDAWAAMHVAERIRTELEAEPVTTADGRKINVTASFGVAQGRRGGTQWLNMIKAADGALYEAKATGRNRVCKAGTGSGRPTRNVA